MTERGPWFDARRKLLDTATSSPWETDPAYPCDIGHPGSEGSEGEWDLSIATAEEPDDAALIVAAVNDYGALLDIAEAAGEARDALAGIVVMLGTGSGDPMGTARRHFERLDGLLDSRASDSQKEPTS